MFERFYSGQIEGDVTVRENGTKRPLQNRFDYRKHAMESSSHPSARTRLAFNLIADVLNSEHRAGEIHEYFARRVVPLLPDRFTISRSRLLAYIEIIEQEKSAKIGVD